MKLFVEAARRIGLAPRVHGWADWLAGQPLPRGYRWRIDSPGENDAVKRHLVRLGGGRVEEPQHGEIWGLRHGWLGLCRALADLAESGEHFVSDPPALGRLFHKPTVHAALSRAGVPVPESPGLAHGAAELHELLDQSGLNRVFIKVSTGSSASGVLALARAPGGRIVAHTTVVREGGRLFNHLRPRRYEDRVEIDAILDALGPEGLHVERWVPKLGLDGKTCDLRVLVIAGEPRHAVVRASSGPLTNLHLGNARGSLDALRARVGDAAWRRACAVCGQAAAVFPEIHTVAVDLLLDHHARPFVAELNAFGDLLPGVLHRGEDSCTAAINTLWGADAAVL